MTTLRTLIISLCFHVANAHAFDIIFPQNLSLKARLGYNLGGTAPIGLSPSIRELNSYRLQPNFSVGLDAIRPINDNWSVLMGLHLENKGMNIDARVKNYYEEIVRGDERISGRFTGNVNTYVREWMFTIPLQAVWSPISKVDFRVGPYFSVVPAKKFNGYAHNGYLRVGDPTGAKVILGEDETSRGFYDFSGDMRNMQWGIDIGADWNCYRRLEVYADISWGVTGIFKKRFKTLEQTLYPIFGTVGVAYKLK